ncbi:hypothetical protein [Streptomyces sp. NPDC088766]|uniref:hypothetical protein n=1 Tax=Streptomyces sp. NPDC088766 TaxID=3365893 RepID=UPI0037F66F27
MVAADTPRSEATVPGTSRQGAGGKVLRHFTMSLDGFVAGPDHAMDRMTGLSFCPGLVEEYAGTTGAAPGGRDGRDASPDAGGIYGGRRQGPVFVLTHRPEDTRPTADATFLTCDAAEAVRTGPAAGPQRPTARTSRSSRPRSAGSSSNAG